MVPYLVQHILAHMAPKAVPETMILPEELLIQQKDYGRALGK